MCFQCLSSLSKDKHKTCLVVWLFVRMCICLMEDQFEFHNLCRHFGEVRIFWRVPTPSSSFLRVRTCLNDQVSGRVGLWG